MPLNPDEMPKMPGDSKTLGAFPFILAGMSFIPIIGVLFGIVTVCWGLATSRLDGKKLAMTGAGGICFTFLLYGGLYYFGFKQREGTNDSLRTNMAQGDLNSLVKDVEFYRLTKGQYPESLDELQKSLPKNSFDLAFMYDPRVIQRAGSNKQFFYKRVDQGHYYLRGVAPDGNPFSPGALVPQIAGAANIGLLATQPNPGS